MGLRSSDFFTSFSAGNRLYTSESDVCRRQILTYKDGPRTERVIYQGLIFQTITNVLITYAYSLYKPFITIVLKK